MKTFIKEKEMRNEQVFLKMTLHLIREWDSFQCAMRSMTTGFEGRCSQ
ncbi:MAG: hypothetical protein JRD64_03055 [Deltaproteobacteria bacterium]|nr:hypothetical protein [Deltaproteobacteria bacterium]